MIVALGLNVASRFGRLGATRGGRLGCSGLLSGLNSRSALSRSGAGRTHVSRAAKKLTDPPTPAGGSAVKNPPPTAATADRSTPAASAAVAAKGNRALALFPRFMRNYARQIAGAPVSHITSFLILHEISAIVPLFAIWGLFHYLDILPTGAMPQWIVEKGVGYIRRMAERNDWTELAHAESGVRLLSQGAAAYALVKVTMPLRLIFSVWATPFFARWVMLPLNRRVAGLFKRKPKA